MPGNSDRISSSAERGASASDSGDVCRDDAGDHQHHPLHELSALADGGLLAISTAWDSSRLPSSLRPLALAVDPVETRSTIASERPRRGAASTEPETRTSSASTRSPRGEPWSWRDRRSRCGGR